MPFDGAFSPVHILIVAVVALLVLGPDRLPDAARTAGKAWREFQQMKSSLVDQVRDFADDAIPSELRESPSRNRSAEAADPNTAGASQIDAPEVLCHEPEPPPAGSDPQQSPTSDG